MALKQKLVKFWKSLSLFKKIALSLALFALASILTILALFLSVKWEIVTDLPSSEELLAINNPLSTELYASNGKLFGKFYEENRGDLKAEDLTDDFKNALISTEDARFYEHNGLDYKALGRVAIKSILLQRDNSGGGSTLTQQLAKNLYPRKRFKMFSLVMNKFREMNIARSLEKTYSKDELLLLYSNTVSFGERAFGLSTASSRFFGKSPENLTLGESATLVGILKAPTYYSPKKNPDRCIHRRNVVLRQMEKYQFIASEIADEAVNTDLKLDYKSLTETTGLGRYFHQLVRKEFEKWAEENPRENGEIYHIKRDGLKIYTSLDYDMQIAAETSMKLHMQRLQKIFDNSWKTGSKYGPGAKFYKAELKKNPLYRKLKSEGKSDKEITEIFQEKKEISLWGWKKYKLTESSREDSIKYYLGLLHAGILAAEPQTGKIKAYVGGLDYGKFQYDNVLSARQVGSTFKPIVYLTAIEKGVTACDYYPNELRVYSSFKDWTPENSDGKYGGFLSVKEALTRSVNTVSVQLMFDAGLDNVVAKAKELGITSPLPKVPSLVLGTADISLKEMVKAYSAIANGGKSPSLHGIVKITDAGGKVLYENNQRIEGQNSATYGTLYDIMANVANEGTAARIYNYDIPFQIMGKTGTTQNQTDGWFIGYTKDLVIGAWVGAQNRGIHFRNLGTGSGGRTALPLAASLFEFNAANGYRPAPLLAELPYSCPDSISQEEYDILQEYPEEFDRIYAERNKDDLIDIIFGPSRTSRTNDEGGNVGDRRRRNTRSSSSSKKKRMSEFEKFRKEVEADLRQIFRKKKKKRKRR